MKLRWQQKAAAFRFFSAAPFGSALYYMAQRFVTRTIPRDLSEPTGWQIEHTRTFRRHFQGDIADARLFEFGAGWDLFSNLVHWCYGVNHQVVIDISPLARASQVNHALRHLRDHPPPGAVRTPSTMVSRDFVAELERVYGMRYLAPADARHTPLEPESIDLICTTSVLEHVPELALHEIMRECHRICRTGAVMSHVVDYTDHYAHADPSITIYNFLRFTEREWQPFNPAIHFQNRMRHFQYGELFERAGFSVVHEQVLQPDESRAWLAGVPLAEPFARMTPEQLLPRTGHWVLVKRSSTAAGS